VTRPVVTLLTDFGSRDGYVGALKGAMLSQAPELRLVDVSHQIERGDVAAAAWALAQAAPHFPPHCVHLVVVDPGVGSARRALACRAGGRLYVAPDNGVLHWVLGDAPEAYALAEPDSASPVFHGRDVFGPAAARLATGSLLARFGSRVAAEELVRLPFADPERRGDCWSATVVHVDHFGNAITNLELEPDAAGVVVLTGREVPMRRTYSDVERGAPVALRGSSNTLELSCNGSSAAVALGIERGDVIVFRLG
jgi:S-adenosylmethionine hydrolase